MKLKLTRNHLDHKAGEEIDVTPEQGKYFEAVGLGIKPEHKIEEPKKSAGRPPKAK